MSTYNYDPVKEPIFNPYNTLHYFYDMEPYYVWGGQPSAPAGTSDAIKANEDRYNNNQDAIDYHSEKEKMFNESKNQ